MHGLVCLLSPQGLEILHWALKQMEVGDMSINNKTTFTSSIYQFCTN